MIAVRRGDLVVGAAKGDYFGSPRPCVVVQSDRVKELDSVLVCPITSDFRLARPMRVRLTPTASGLKSLSDVMVDKVLPMPRAKIAQVVGRLPAVQIQLIDAALAFVLGLSQQPLKKRVKRRT